MTNKDKNEVIEVNQAFYRAFEKKDMDGMNLVWFQGNSSSCIHPGGEILQGWENIRNSWELIFRNTEYLEIDIELVTVEIGNQIGYIVLQENLLQISRGKRLQAQSVATNIYQKMAQKWYLVTHHGSPRMG
ncbi:MAG: nuclear transport factor 2 family protein [Gomphosphaeria aponina SAG 52.96 = DSM 107014]|uniref:Nuclear transport factor 2 family protein n=1 Tax=Gomphosphaeria aponina SAG 52.96 = DSM 107014 TaxID=1521640 RepID=A0A941GRX9_9CHRO|nr:nuclear transport factor 2 family protein [Gomphosphaeria aponina SAG 52.96 = DSM 107014]